MPYIYQHYPLAMYRNGVYRAVANEAEEAEAAAEGFTDYVSDREGKTPAVAASVPAADASTVVAAVSEPAKRRPGRPRKDK